MAKHKGGRPQSPQQNPRDEFAAQAAKEAAAEVAAQVADVISPAVAASGLYLEEVKLVGAGNTQVLRITIDLPETETGSLDMDRLGEVSRAISAALDANDVVPGAYNLEVSTPGATRPMTVVRHYRRAIGRLAKLETIDGTEITARVKDIATNSNGEDIVILQPSAGADIELPFGQIRKGKVELEMSRVAAAIFDEDEDEDDEEFEENFDE